MNDEVKLHKLIAKIKENLAKENKFGRGSVISGLGGICWEEPVEEYEARMLKLGDEYITYLKEKKQDTLNKMNEEVAELSKLINKFETKLRSNT